MCLNHLKHGEAINRNGGIMGVSRKKKGISSGYHGDIIELNTILTKNGIHLIYIYIHIYIYGGFHSHGGIPIAGWFIRGNPI